MSRDRSLDPVRAAAILLGAGWGGFIGGVALHQIAQWHNMLSAVLPPTTMEAMRTNMVADGWFHAAVGLFTVAGVFMLYHAGRQQRPFPSLRWSVGFIPVGIGLFNLVEGVVDLLLLELHHVRDVPRHVPSYDHLFLLIGGLGPLGLGWFLARSADAPAAPSARQ